VAEEDRGEGVPSELRHRPDELHVVDPSPTPVHLSAPAPFERGCSRKHRVGRGEGLCLDKVVQEPDDDQPKRAAAIAGEQDVRIAVRDPWEAAAEPPDG
jgi:hypothetical protein